MLSRTLGLDGLQHQRTPSNLTKTAFDRFLAAFDSDREIAGHKYEITRRKLIKFFECRGCHSAEDQADETMDLVCKKVRDGLALRGDDLSRYFYGVARNVLKVYRTSLRKSPAPLDCLPAFAHPFVSGVEPTGSALEVDETERHFQALDQCLELLPSDDVHLLLNYYKASGSSKRAERESLAKDLGVPLNAVRIRAFRARRKLAELIKDYLRGNSYLDNE